MEKYDIWLNIAEEDLQAAQWSFKGDQFLWTVFMCQQCIEKTIKAIYIYKKGDHAPRKHDLLSLAKSADLFESLNDQYIDLFTYLNLYYIETRYSEKRQELKAKCNKENTLTIINQTKEAFEWLKNKLKK
jgi:HEPN domain-containing protein